MAQTALLRTIALLVAFASAGSLFARGQSWDFLGYTQVDGSQDHGRIQIARRDLLFRTIQLRVSGDPIFFDRLVLHFDNGASKEFSVGDRISSAGRNYDINLSVEHRVLTSVDLWYYNESWGHNPRVSLYGIRVSDRDTESVLSQH
jgi:hypothetical protein